MLSLTAMNGEKCAEGKTRKIAFVLSVVRGKCIADWLGISSLVLGSREVTPFVADISYIKFMR